SRMPRTTSVEEESREVPSVEGAPMKLSKQEETSLLDLPNEMLVQIFAHLDFADRSRFRVNRRLREIESTFEERGRRKNTLVVRFPAVDNDALMSVAGCHPRRSVPSIKELIRDDFRFDVIYLSISPALKVK
ncbi:hypothetical protein PFISCL1PPCAC_13295, partial [Pristionchus fissidentatus]